MKSKLIEWIVEALWTTPYEFSVGGRGCGTIIGIAERIAEHLIANGATIQRWIPVSEMLPEENEKVLVFGNDCFALSEIFSRDCDGEPMWGYTGIGCDPKYWMPLPEPPKEEV